MRRSRRLCGLAPEEQAIDQVCAICQGRILVDLLGRCVCTSCCGMLLHRSCHRMMVERVTTCGQCRRPNVGHVRSVVYETDEESEQDDEDEGMATLRYRIDGYRRESRHLNTHYEGSSSWDVLPFRIDTAIWERYYTMLVNFADQYSGRVMYVHGVVELPIEPTEEVRVAVYELFDYNTPFAMFPTFRYRLFFSRNERADVEIQRLTLLPYPDGPSMYAADNLWT